MKSGVSQIELKPFGFEVKTDSKAGVSSADRETLRALFARDGLILIRGLDFSLEEQLEFCGIFGPALRSPGETYIVSNVHKDGILGTTELLFHVDIPYVPVPYAAGALYAVDISPGAAATRYVSGFRAYEALPPDFRRRIDSLNTIQLRQRVADRRNRLADAQPGDNCAIQPLVGRERGTGRRYLAAGEWHTGYVIGMTEAESDRLLEEYFALFYSPENIYEHEWKKGDLVIWNNLAIQHARKPTGSGPRTLQRVSMSEFAYWDQYPADRPSTEELDVYSNLPRR